MILEYNVRRTSRNCVNFFFNNSRNNLNVVSLCKYIRNYMLLYTTRAKYVIDSRNQNY